MVKKTGFALLLLGLAMPVFAHKLNVFAFVEGNNVSVEAYFSDGTGAKNAKVTVTDKAGDLIDQGRANEKGQYQFTLPVKTGKADLLIKVDAGLGHVASYHLGAEANTRPALAGSKTSVTGSASAADIEQAVTRAIKPLAREIAELKQKSRLSDIIGGIGYIMGILGVFAYLKYRKESQVK